MINEFRAKASELEEANEFYQYDFINLILAKIAKDYKQCHSYVSNIMAKYYFHVIKDKELKLSRIEHANTEKTKVIKFKSTENKSISHFQDYLSNSNVFKALGLTQSDNFGQLQS